MFLPRARNIDGDARAEDEKMPQVLKALGALESRVAALEAENRQYRSDAAAARPRSGRSNRNSARSPAAPRRPDSSRLPVTRW
jgi:hypothetical protein